MRAFSRARQAGLFSFYALAPLLVLCLVLAGCGKEEPELVARYKNEVLSRQELLHFIPTNVNSADSERLAQLYIDKWLLEQAAVDMAYDSILDLEDRIKYPMADFKRKLIYQQLLLQNIYTQVDSNVADSTLERFYNERKRDYRATTYYYQYIYLQVADSVDAGKLQTIFRNFNDSTSLADITSWAEQFAINAKLDTGWTSAVGLEQLEEQTGLELAGLRDGQYVLGQAGQNGEISGYRHYFYMLGRLAPNSQLPIEVVEPSLRAAIINERRHRAVVRFETQVLQKAYANNAIDKY